jgi:hypothetical protein
MNGHIYKTHTYDAYTFPLFLQIVKYTELTMRLSFWVKFLVALWLRLVVVTNAQADSPDSRGKTPYDYVNPLIGTTNGGEQNDWTYTRQASTDSNHAMSFPAQHSHLVSYYVPHKHFAL